METTTVAGGVVGQTTSGPDGKPAVRTVHGTNIEGSEQLFAADLWSPRGRAVKVLEEAHNRNPENFDQQALRVAALYSAAMSPLHTVTRALSEADAQCSRWGLRQVRDRPRDGLDEGDE